MTGEGIPSDDLARFMKDMIGAVRNGRRIAEVEARLDARA